MKRVIVRRVLALRVRFCRESFKLFLEPKGELSKVAVRTVRQL